MTTDRPTLVERLRDDCLSRWSDTVIECNAERREAADRLEKADTLAEAVEAFAPHDSSYDHGQDDVPCRRCDLADALVAYRSASKEEGT